MIHIQVSPYIKKFVDLHFGHPVQLHNKTTSHILLRALLFRTTQLALFPEYDHTRVLPCTIQIMPPANAESMPRNYQGSRLRLVNQFFENLFLEKMKEYADRQPLNHNRRRGEHNLKVQLAKYCEQYQIMIDEDITEDALVKMYYRYRKWLDGTEISPSPHTDSMQTLADAV